MPRSRSWVSRHLTLFFLSTSVLILAFLFSSSSPLARKLPTLAQIKAYSNLFRPAHQPSSSSMPKAPVYFFSHGGPDVQYNKTHPVYPILQAIGKEITQKVKPKAVVVFSAHWQAEPNEIHLNDAEDTDLIYDFYGFPPEFYQATFPSKGSPALASHILTLLSASGIQARGLQRGLDHGVFSGFNVAFDPASNPLRCPLVQVSLFGSEDPDAHYRLGRAVAPLRDDNVVVIGTGMTAHNLRDMRLAWGSPAPIPYVVSFDEALREAVEADPGVRQERMAAVARRPDAKLAHPWADHLMPVYVAAGAAGEDKGVQTWTLHEGSFAWGQYRFGDVPA
ncbi:LigB-domain-containing protein [Parathielavia hyrcaniae]|uniref:LigB-domain-containing protein n=1 Tax=Parathielavia hyrcaniae TaxID=113614 RepID=A0AAN6Q330_9PEZI|nr:LigB-domain-containing protein [Parathielavia hyrcaniae]